MFTSLSRQVGGTAREYLNNNQCIRRRGILQFGLWKHNLKWWANRRSEVPIRLGAISRCYKCSVTLPAGWEGERRAVSRMSTDTWGGMWDTMWWSERWTHSSRKTGTNPHMSFENLAHFPSLMFCRNSSSETEGGKCNKKKKKKRNWLAIINMFKQYYKKMSCSCSLKCVHMASLQKTAVSRCLSSMVNTVTPKEVRSHWNESVPLLPWAERRARYTSLLLFFQADGRGDTAVCPKSNPHPACLSSGNSRPSRFLNIGIVQGVTAMLLSCMLCSYEHLPLLTLPRAGPECTTSSPSRSVSCTLCH